MLVAMDLRSLLETAAACLFLACWLGYERYHDRRLRRDPSSTRYGDLVARQTRWIETVVADGAPLVVIHTLRTFGRYSIFLGSLTLLAVGGAFGLLLSSERLLALCRITRVYGHPSHELLQLKIILLTVVLALAFLNFVWGLRALLAAHLFTAGKEGEDKECSVGLQRYLEYFQLDFRHGLRASYYAVVLLIWPFNTELFVLATLTLTVMLARYDLGRE